MDKEKLEVLNLIQTAADKESDRFWTRYNIMLLANTGLVAVAAWVFKELAELKKGGFGFLPGAVGLLGIAVAGAWLISIVLGRYYERRLFEDLNALVTADRFLMYFVRFRNESNPRIRAPRFLPNITYLFGSFPICFLSFWDYNVYKISALDCAIYLWPTFTIMAAFTIVPIGIFIYAVWADKHPD